jgi:hypothetical protein
MVDYPLAKAYVFSKMLGCQITILCFQQHAGFVRNISEIIEYLRALGNSAAVPSSLVKKRFTDSKAHSGFVPRFGPLFPMAK